MTSAAATIALTYRGEDIQDLDSIFLEIVRGLNERPTARGTDVIVPARFGRVVHNRVPDVLVIELRGFVRGVAGYGDVDDGDAFATARSNFRTLFNPALDPDALIATFEDGTQRTIDARTLNTVWEQIVPTFHRVSVELESVDPDWSVVTS